MKKTIKILKGLPASGKSTYAKELASKGWVRTNKDDIRKMLYGDNFKRKNEKQVIRIRDAIIRDTLAVGKNVVVDDTNLNPVHISSINKIAKEFDANVIIDDSFLNVPISECIKRDLKRPNSVGQSVIWDMYYKWIDSPAKDSALWKDDLPRCIIVDIDGTLAHMKNRSPYEWQKVGNDVPDKLVAHLVDGINAIGYAKVIIFSGRDSICRQSTEQWLRDNCIDYDELYMRDKNDSRADDIIKKELYDEHIKDKFTVLGVIDDRPRVARMWLDLGLKVLWAGNPYLEF